jgi:alpha-aminoadipate/glutamate carrier protein LysW
MAICPECEAHIDIEEDEYEEGQTLDCPECGVELEVVTTNPVELDLVDQEKEEDEEEAGEASW